MDHSFQGLAASISAFKELESKRHGRSSLIRIADECLRVISPTPSDSLTSTNVADGIAKSDGESIDSSPSTSSVADFPASLHLARDHERAMAILAGSGRRCSELFARSGQSSLWQRTLTTYFFTKVDGLSTRFTHSWKPRVTRRSRRLYFRLALLEPRSGATEFGLWPTPTVHGLHNRKGASTKSGDGLSTAVKLWPTPNATDGSKAPKFFARGNPSLPTAVKMFPTPKASDATGGRAYKKPPSREGGFQLKEVIPGSLNPTWVEWLMGFPLGWTVCEDSATRSSRKSRNSSGAGS